MSNYLDQKHRDLISMHSDLIQAAQSEPLSDDMLVREAGMRPHDWNEYLEYVNTCLTAPGGSLIPRTLLEWRDSKTGIHELPKSEDVSEAFARLNDWITTHPFSDWRVSNDLVGWLENPANKQS